MCVSVYFLETILQFTEIKNIQTTLFGNVKICLLDKPYPTIWLLGKQSCKNKNIGYVICIKKYALNHKNKLVPRTGYES